MLKSVKKIWRAILSLLLLSLLVGLGFEIYSLVLAYHTRELRLPPTMGNFQTVIERLDQPEADKPFLFAVAGDTNGIGTFEFLCEQLRKEPLSFMVLLGDQVRTGREGYQRYLISETPEWNLPFPVFFIMGNHDINPEDFPRSRFEQVYGPTNFCFQYRRCLFIGLRIEEAPADNAESLRFLEENLAAPRDPNGLTFVFMHILLPLEGAYSNRAFAEAERLRAILDRSQVDYVFAGDYHGYDRTRVGKTNYLVSGGGGLAPGERQIWQVSSRPGPAGQPQPGHRKNPPG